ncbi:MAG: M23 family metallopeptidase [Spirochaetaceae bacterium]
MKKVFISLILLLTAQIYSIEFITQKEVFQGEPITFIITPIKNHVDCTFTIYNDKGKKILDIYGFDYYLMEKNSLILLGLGGIPSNLPIGKYTVIAKGSSQLHDFEIEDEFIVKAIDYPKTVLKANKKMNTIINGPKDPKRDIQSKSLWEAFSSFTKYNLYEDGKLTKPVNGGRHSSAYGFLRETIYPNGKNSTSVHKGEDLAIKTGTPVVSDGIGLVLLAEERIITGNTVVIEHLPGVKSVYYHMDSLNVEKGQMVLRGDKIGEVGTTGFSTGPHLHWEIRFSTVPVNVMLFIEKELIDKKLILNMINTTNNKRGG